MTRSEAIPLRSGPLGIRIEVDLTALRSGGLGQDAPVGGLDIPVTVEGDWPEMAPDGHAGGTFGSRVAAGSVELPVDVDPDSRGAEALRPPDAPEERRAPAARALHPGEMVAARYRVLRRLGTGGMGVVYACAHAFLDRMVALKVVRDDTTGDPQATERLFQEARLAAKIQSPHVVQVLDCGCLPDGSPYVAMEFIEGRDLLTVLREIGPLPPARVIDYVLQACRGLAAAHRHGIVHRDLKPENMILAGSAEGIECLKIIDFGISKELAPEAGRYATDPRSSVGSPHYMSPEQIATPDRVDARTDLWSLGVVMYELLVGKPPFGGAAPYDVCLSVMVSSPPNPRVARPDLPPALTDIILRCLEKHPQQRFQSAEALAGALVEARAQLHVGPTSCDAGRDSDAARESAALSTRRVGGQTRHSGSWLRALAPVLTGAAGMLLTAPTFAEGPCRADGTRPDPRVHELRIPQSPRLAPPRGVRVGSLSLWGVRMALGIDSRDAGAVVLLRFGNGAGDEARGQRREGRGPTAETSSPDERSEAPAAVLAQITAVDSAPVRCASR